MPTEIKRSVCPYDCPDTCGLLVEVKEGRAVRVTGDPEHPYTRGFLCPKMLHYEKTVHSPRRLTTPLIRTGAKGSGAFRPLSWDEAIAIIADRWRDIIARHGAEAILPYSYAGTMGLIQRNAGHPFFHRLGASRLARTICSPAKDAGWKAVMGETPACHPDDVAESDLVILWGINAAATSIHFLHGVREAKKKGAAVWLIDTYETPTAASADRVFLVRPGSDGALALGLMHILAREGLVDRRFLAGHVQGYDELAAQVLPDYHAGAGRRADRPARHRSWKWRRAVWRGPRSLHQARQRLVPLRQRRHDRPHHRLPAGTHRSLRQTGRRLFPGNLHRRGLCHERGAPGGLHADADPHRQHELPRRRPQQSSTTRRSLPSMSTTPTRPPSPPTRMPCFAGLARDDLFTVVHERFMTDTARFADIVLPATSSLEHSDLYRSYGTYCIQRAAAVIPPVGESRSNWEVFSLLAEAMGFTDPFFRQNADESHRPPLGNPGAASA